MEKFGEWEVYTITDDFTDEKTYMVHSSCDSEICMPHLDTLDMIFFDSGILQWMLTHKAAKGCSSTSKDSIPVLFRVDKDEVFTIQMEPLLDGRAKLKLKPKESTNIDFLFLPIHLMGGQKLKVRINDLEECGIQTDLEFNLDGFVDAYEPLSKAMMEYAEKNLE